MYAVIQAGGRQYRVAEGDVIQVEREAALRPTDGKLAFERVLLVAGEGEARVGRPLVEGARVTASLLGETRGPKIRVFKMKRRKGYRRLRGHRQDLFSVRIEGIESGAKTRKKKGQQEGN